MSKKLPSNQCNTLHLPSKISSLTIGELLNHPDTVVVKKGNKLSMRRQTEDGVATLELSSYATGRQEAKMSSLPRRERKKDYREDIIAMKRSGMLQKDIAFELGISESYVTKILRQPGR